MNPTACLAQSDHPVDDTEDILQALDAVVALVCPTTQGEELTLVGRMDFHVLLLLLMRHLKAALELMH